MRSCKFRLIILSFLLLSSSFGFDDNQCLKDEFSVDILHKGTPFGLLPVRLSLKKNGCIMTVEHEKLKYLKERWEVDVCREPVHIKKGSGAVEVLKKTSNCEGKGRNAFCSEYLKLKKLIQDDGLIFAPGEKENLATDHGKAYCTYLLFNKYLGESFVFNRGEDYKGLLFGKRPIQNSANPAEKATTISVPVPVMEGGPSAVPVIEDSSEKPVENDSHNQSNNGKGFF